MKFRQDTLNTLKLVFTESALRNTLDIEIILQLCITHEGDRKQANSE
jgi:hypothetical protein